MCVCAGKYVSYIRGRKETQIRTAKSSFTRKFLASTSEQRFGTNVKDNTRQFWFFPLPGWWIEIRIIGGDYIIEGWGGRLGKIMKCSSHYVEVVVLCLCLLGQGGWDTD